MSIEDGLKDGRLREGQLRRYALIDGAEGAFFPVPSETGIVPVEDEHGGYNPIYTWYWDREKTVVGIRPSHHTAFTDRFLDTTDAVIVSTGDLRNLLVCRARADDLQSCLEDRSWILGLYNSERNPHEEPLRMLVDMLASGRPVYAYMARERQDSPKANILTFSAEQPPIGTSYQEVQPMRVIIGERMLVP
jgi:hypothetical protein